MSKAVAVMDKGTTDMALPDYLTGNEMSGLEGLGNGDFKIPRIILLQALSPQIQSFPGEARPGEFWHTGLNVSLGSTFEFVPLLARKRVIVWKPREDGGGILAFSADGKSWAIGGDTKHSVKIKGRKEPVIWDTKKDVASSHLLDWGTYNPDDADSAPAASLSYEYLCYMPSAQHLSPAVLSCTKTALAKARAFNTSLLTMAQARRPSYCLKVNCFVEQQSDQGNTWFIPNFKMNGVVPKEVYEITKVMAEQNADYVAEIAQEDEAVAVDATANEAF